VAVRIKWDPLLKCGPACCREHENREQSRSLAIVRLTKREIEENRKQKSAGKNRLRQKMLKRFRYERLNAMCKL